MVAVGIDANLDGDLDIFALVDNSGSNQLRIADPGVGTQTSPATTSIATTGLSYPETAANINWSPVTIVIDPTATSFDVDGPPGPTSTDYFVSFALPFQDIVNRLALLGVTGVDQNTQFRYVLGTSTTTTTLAQDLAGPAGSTASTLLWDDSGLLAMSNPYAAGAGLVIPEPGTGLSLGLGLLGLAVARRRR
jgi:hypothetical protein